MTQELDLRTARNFVRNIDLQVLRGTQKALRETGFGARRHWELFASRRFDEGGPPTAYIRKAGLFHQPWLQGDKGATHVLFFLRGAGAPGDRGPKPSSGRVTPAMVLRAQEKGGLRAQKAFERKLVGVLRSATRGSRFASATGKVGRRRNLFRSIIGEDDFQFVPPKGGGGGHFVSKPNVLFRRGNPKRGAVDTIASRVGRVKSRKTITVFKSKRGNLLVVRRPVGKRASKRQTDLLMIGVRNPRYQRRLDFSNEMLRYFRNNIESKFRKTMIFRFNKLV